MYGRVMTIGATVAIGLSTPVFLLGLSREQVRLEQIRGRDLAAILTASSGNATALERSLARLGPQTTVSAVDQGTGRIVAGAGVGQLLESVGLDSIGRILTGPDGWYVSRNFRDRVVATHAIPRENGPGLVLVATSPASDYAADLTRTGLLALAVLIVALAIGYLILHRFARGLVEPIERLRAAATEMAAGNLAVAPVAYPGGDELATLASAFDRMADRVRTDERELRAAYQRLINTQSQLIQAEKLSTVGRLVSGVAHELNNPLTAVLHLTEELADMPSLTAEDKELLRIVRQQANRARAIVRDLLAVVRGREVRRERIVVAELVDNVVRGMRAILDESGVRVRTDVSPGAPDLDADRAGVEQVLVNLLQNAAQAAGRNGEIRLRAEPGAGDAGVVFTVEDDGPGIAPEVLPRIFEPFFTTKREGEGTGLGLFVTLGVVEAHGGSIRGENRGAGERGARFTVTLPAHAGVEHDAAAPPVREPAVAAPGRLLLVEDEAAIRFALNRWFTRRGWDVTEAPDGDDALAHCLAASPRGFDLILTDLKMPGLSGVELVDRLAVLRPDLHARIIIMTGDVASPEVAALIGRTDRPILEKPFSFEVLEEVVGRVAAGE
jgi:signal transduction histidine kinase/CheY-like chemotaxis protein